MADRRCYRITFHNQGKVFEIYAKSVGQGALFGFVEVEQLLFGQHSRVVVDPSEESLRNEFKGVKRVYVPLHAVVRIDEVEELGVARISEPAAGDAKLTPFPAAIYRNPGDGSDESGK